MKEVKLISLRLKNFKGVFDKAIEFGDNTSIYGANRAGKSTVYSAFNWLLTGKDEFDRKDFEIKNTVKKELNCQAHEVEAVLLVDDELITLKRVFLEKWTKPKGQSTKVFDGHTTDFYYNNVPCNLGEYTSKVEEIIPAKLIKLLTNPMYFNSLKPEDQRKGLMGIAGPITEDQIFSSIITPENDYTKLKNAFLQKKTSEEWKGELRSKKADLKKKIAEIPARLDEAKHNMPEALAWATIEKQVDQKRVDIAAIAKILSDSSTALAERQKGINGKSNSLFAKKQALANITAGIRTELENKQSTSTQITSIQSKITSAKSEAARLKKEISQKEAQIVGYQDEIIKLDVLIEGNRTKWSAINAEKFSFDESKCECSQCKQTLPEDKIEVLKAEMLKNFNDDVATRKAEEVRKSNKSKADKASQQSNIDDANIAISHLQITLEAEFNKLSELETELGRLMETEKKTPVFDLQAAVEAKINLNGDALNLMDEITQLEEGIKSDTSNLDKQDNSETEEKKRVLESELKLLEDKLALKTTILNTQRRIGELEKEEQKIAQEIADIENWEFEIESFTRAQMDILQTRVNGMFRFVKFRLFENLVNGGISETCVAELNGVPYPTLNTESKLVAGLDVLETLSNHYNIHAPVFCDCRESVTSIPESKSQVISLFVSPQDIDLRVEKDGNNKHYKVA